MEGLEPCFEYDMVFVMLEYILKLAPVMLYVSYCYMNLTVLSNGPNLFR